MPTSVKEKINCETIYTALEIDYKSAIKRIPPNLSKEEKKIWFLHNTLIPTKIIDEIIKK